MVPATVKRTVYWTNALLSLIDHLDNGNQAFLFSRCDGTCSWFRIRNFWLMNCLELVWAYSMMRYWGLILCLLVTPQLIGGCDTTSAIYGHRKATIFNKISKQASESLTEVMQNQNAKWLSADDANIWRQSQWREQNWWVSESYALQNRTVTKNGLQFPISFGYTTKLLLEWLQMTCGC